MIYFTSGAMGSGKSRLLLSELFEARKRGKKVEVFATDGIIESRSGETEHCPSLLDYPSALWDIVEVDTDIIFVDEAQALCDSQINQLRDLAYNYNMDIMLYGLIMGADGKMLGNAKRILEIADEVTIIKTYCEFCGERNATLSVRVDGEGYPIPADNDKVEKSNYKACCHKCAHNHKIF